MRYAVSATGRNIWIKVAERLVSKSHVPVLWIGDQRLDSEVTKRFGKICVSLDDLKDNPWRVRAKADARLVEEVKQAQEYRRYKEQAIKMMDRVDTYGMYRRVDREMAFYWLLFWACELVKERRVDALIMAEAPHSAPQFVLWMVCQCLGKRTYAFGNLTIGPLVYLEEYGSGEMVEVGKKHCSEFESVYQKAEQSLTEEIRSKESQLMLGRIALDESQKRSTRGSRLRSLQDMRYEIKGGLKRLAERMKDGSRYRPGPIERVGIIQRLCLKWGLEREIGRSLARDKGKNTVNKKRYVYFPLHFEPERTTNPDGGKYFSQVEAIITLRSVLPSEFEIRVKEHPYQKSDLKRGARGYSSYIEDVVNGLEGVRMVSIKEDSRLLIKESAFVATITGTSAIEALCMKKRVVYFGRPWYRGISKDIVPIDEVSKVVSQLEQVSQDLEQEITLSIRDFTRRFCVPGFINPSQERAYSSVLGDDSKIAEETELEGFLALLERSLGDY